MRCLYAVLLPLVGSLVAAAPAAPRASAQPSSATAAPTPAPAPLPSLDEVVAAHVRARGGAERLHALRSMRATGVAFFPGGKQAPVVREIARPGRIRLEITYQGLSSVYAHDGQNGWQVAPLQGQFEPTPLPESLASPSVDQLDIEGPLVDWRAKGHAVELVGRTTVGGRSAYEIELRLAGGQQRRDFLDAETFLALRTDVERVFGGERVALETTLGDYRAVEGLVFPFSIETRRRGRPQSLRFEVRKVEVNPAIDESRFRMPPPAAPSAAPPAAPAPTPAPTPTPTPR